MRFNDRTADRQPHPQPARFGRVERLEQPLNALGSQARTRIPHRDEHSFRVGFRSADEQIPRPFAACAHCLHSVDQQIENHLLQLYSIALNSWQRLRSCVRTEMPFFDISFRVNPMTSKTASLISNLSVRGGAFLTRARIRSTTSLAWTPLFTMKSRAPRTSSTAGG